MFKRGAKHGAKWTPEDDAVLRNSCEAGDYLEDIAKRLERSIESVRTRANVLGVPCRSGRGKNKAWPR